MTTNGEVITGSDFKRMVTGAYSEFLLEYENINALDRKLRLLPYVYRTSKTTIAQLARVFGLERDRVATFLGKKKGDNSSEGQS